MKKLKLLTLLSVMMIFGMMSIGSGSTDGDKKEITSSSESTEVALDENEDVATNDAATDLAAEDNKNEDALTTTIEEQILIDDEDFKVTAVSYEKDSIWGDGIKVLIENDRAEDIGIGCTALIVNDYMITDLFAAEVAAGKKAYETLNLSNMQLEAAGIENVGQIEIYFHTYDSDSYKSIKDYDCVTIKTSNYDDMDTAINDEGHELYNENGVRIVGKYVDESSFWGAAVLLYVENTSGQDLKVYCDDMSINGFMVTPYFSCDIYNGKKALKEITLLSSQLEENNITEIEDIELKFKISDKNYKSIAESEPISFSAK